MARNADLEFRIDANVTGIPALQQAERAVKSLDGQMRRSGVVANQFGGALGGVGKDIRKTILGGVQQAGYQFGDFAVQVANGTSAVQAFGQQGAQLLGIFGPIGAILGAGVAIFSAIAVAAQRSGKAVGSFKQELDETNASMEQYISLASRASVASAGMFGDLKNLAEQNSTVLNDLIAIAKIEAFSNIQQLNQALVDVAENSSWVKTSVAEVGDLLEQSVMAIIAANMGGRLGRDINEFRLALERLKTATGLQDQYEAALALREQFISAVGPIDLMNEKQRDFMKSLAQTIQQMELLGATTQGTFVNVKRLSDQRFTSLTTEDQLMQQIVGRNQKSLQMESERRNKQVQRVTSLTVEDQLMQQIVGRNQKSLQMESERLNKQVQRFTSLTVEDQLMQQIVGRNQKSLDMEAERRNKQVQRVTSLDVEDQLMQQIVGLNETSLEIERQRKANLDQLVANQASMARIMMSISADPEERLMARGVGIDSDALAKATEFFAELERNAREAAKIGDPLGDLTKRISAERELLRATDAERQVRMAIYDADRKYSPEMVQNAIDLVQAYETELEALEKIKSANEAVASTIENSMTDAFMAIVDGTKKPIEAFKDMARLIIAELYKVLVVQHMVGSVEKGTGLAGALGKALGFRAMGGPITAGKPYMVGERGPELIVPSRNASVVPNNQLSAGGVTVNQNISFGAGVSRAEIQAMLPRIVESTKAAVFDAQRRSVTGRGYA